MVILRFLLSFPCKTIIFFIINSIFINTMNNNITKNNTKHKLCNIHLKHQEWVFLKKDKYCNVWPQWKQIWCGIKLTYSWLINARHYHSTFQSVQARLRRMAWFFWLDQSLYSRRRSIPLPPKIIFYNCWTVLYNKLVIYTVTGIGLDFSWR